MRRITTCATLTIIAVTLLCALLVPGGAAPESEHTSDQTLIDCIARAAGLPARSAALIVDYPLDGTLFPPEGVAPTFRWGGACAADTWLVTIEFGDGEPALRHLCSACEWTPTARQWQAVKRRSLERTATVTITGVKRMMPDTILATGRITCRTSRDEVGAPIFYREVNLPFIHAVKDPSEIRWRFGEISTTQPPRIVLQGLPVCGNCHSFSSDGSVLGMDVDYANSRGSYVITPVTPEIVLDKDKVITWNDYKREDQQQTFGLLSQVSPDGRYVVSTVKDRSVFVPRPDLAFSQLFFPIQGILVIFDRATGKFSDLPGANDPAFVQSNPTWSPDGKHIVFARSEAYHLKHAPAGTSAVMTPEDCAEFLEGGETFRFDVYRIPFNEGQGGRPEPLPGASHNGMSNYFARYSPDGKWIVFCRARSFMLLQPDSELYIIPAEGGEARRLACNLHRMNSWHSWSPNSKWLVFSSKASSPYTQLFLTHIDADGQSSPPVLLAHFTTAGRAANIPEFVNAGSRAIQNIRQQFLDDLSYVRAGSESLRYGDPEVAEESLRHALQLNPRNAAAHCDLGYILMQRGILAQAKVHLTQAIEYGGDERDAHNNLAALLIREGKFQDAITHARTAAEIDPGYYRAQLNLGTALVHAGRPQEAVTPLSVATELAPRDPFTHYQLAQAWHHQNELAQAADHYGRALQLQADYVPALVGLALVRATAENAPLRDAQQALALALQAGQLTHYRDAMVLEVQARIYASVGRLPDAIATAQRALAIAKSTGADELAAAIEQQLKQFKRSSS